MEVFTSAGNGVGMPTSATDLRYGRRGGGWLPRGAGGPAVTVPCDVCGAPVHVGTRHQVCAEALELAAAAEVTDGQLALG